MWVSTKRLNEILNNHEESVANHNMLVKGFAELQKSLADKDAVIAALTKQLNSYESKWIKTRCPHCSNPIDFHTMEKS